MKRIMALISTVALAAAPAGAQLFDQIVDIPGAEMIAYSIVETSTGGYITAGRFGPVGGSDIHVVNYDPNGAILWEFIFDGSGSNDVAYSVIESPSTGDFIIAGYTDAGAPIGFPDKQTFVMRLNPAGGLLWFNLYDGTMMTDLVHSPDPGPSIIETLSGELAFVANHNGLPIYTRLAPNGVVIAGAAYNIASGVPDLFDVTAAAFTDLKELPDSSIIISGSVNTIPPLATPSTRPIFIRVDPLATTVLGAAVYELTGPICAPGAPTYDDGRALDVRSDNLVYLTGKTDIGGEGIDPNTGDPIPNATHLLLIDPFQAVPPTFSARIYDPNANGCFPDTESLTPAYATLRTDPLNDNAIIGVTLLSDTMLPPPFSSASGLLIADPLLNSLGAFHYLENTENQSAIRHLSTCGYALAGGAFVASTPFPPFASDAIHLVKTDDLARNFCTQVPLWFVDIDIPAQEHPLSLSFVQVDPEVPYPIIMFTLNSSTSSCSFPTCTPFGACCTPLVAGGCIDGVSQADCIDPAIYAGVFQGNGTTCATHPCPATGACCSLAAGGCIDGITQADCTDPATFAGVYQGDGTTCATHPCPSTGACCFSCLGGTQQPCVELAPADCDGLDGVFTAIGQPCAATNCSDYCPGDVNRDGLTDLNDFIVLAGNFGLCGVGRSQGDLNCDTCVDLNDFIVLAGDFGCVRP